jgi:phospholipid/cholesterol/gamma-HCH transport system substrate-binding protein
MRRRVTWLFAIVAVAAAGLPACSLAGGEDTYEIVAYFPRAVSVYPSSDVRVLGLEAGSVADVEIDGARVKITLRVKQSVPVPADVRAALVPRSLIGERYVQLFPVWREGDPKADDGHVIEVDDTVVPVEPDEALAALKDFLDKLDPDGLGTVVGNLADDLEGNGETLGSAMGELSDLVGTFAEADEDLLAIVDQFDDFTATLTTREQQLADVLDSFGTATDVLADERKDLEALIGALARVSEDGLDLLAEHSQALRRDVEILTHVTQAIDANLASVEQLLASGPRLVDGIAAAYNPHLRAVNLRQSFGPVAADVVNDALPPGSPNICVPVPDATCDGGVIVFNERDRQPVTASIAAPASPVDAILKLLDVPAGPRERPSGRSPGTIIRDAAAWLSGGDG